MKITEISSSANGESNRSENEEEKADENVKSSRKQTLLDKFRIPIEQLDFEYVKNCNDVLKIERILRILRSGEEGTYVELEKCVEARLESLKPSSRLLRTETPALRSTELESSQQKDIENGIVEWLSKMEPRVEPNAIFYSKSEDYPAFPLPVRGSSEQSTQELKPRQSATNAKGGASKDRIKSWEYDKWDKYDVETELTKLDIKDMQREEWEKREKPKVIQEQERIKRLMKDEGFEKTQSTSSRPKSSLNSKQNQPFPKTEIKDLGKSYIEEIDDEDGIQVCTPASFVHNGQNTRKTKIVIEDLQIPI